MACDLELFERMIRNLLHVHVTRPSQDADVYAGFAQKYCYDPVLQPVFQADALKALVEGMEDHVLYDARGKIDTCIVFFRFQGEAFIVGPFVRRAFDETNTLSVLMANRIPASVAASIRLYYSAFPMVSVTHVRLAVMAIIQAFADSTEEYEVRRLESPEAERARERDRRADTMDYSTVYRHYDLENIFLHAVETGDTENVLVAFYRMNINAMGQNRYVNAIYQNPVIGLSMVRVMARKAAERGGASVIAINDITQRGAQKVLASGRMEQQLHDTADMLLELTEAVKRARMPNANYSPPVRRAVEYLQLNFSQEVSPGLLANMVALSETYFTKCFKKEVGMTVSQYLARLRCEEAAHLLRESDVTVQEIAAFVGYPDNNYFVKVFKAQYGVTPSAYRADPGKG